MGDADMGRRRFLRNSTLAGAAVAVPVGAGYAGYQLSPTDASASTSKQPPDSAQAGVRHFVSRPDLRPPRVTVVGDQDHDRGAANSAASPEYLVLAPKDYRTTGPAQEGCLIVDRQGEPVWFLPRDTDDIVPMGFAVQSYRGEPVLTWWQGTIAKGHGNGTGMIYDRAYREVAQVRAGNGLEADLHEFLLTERDTALLIAYHSQPADLSGLGGPKQGWAYACSVQEVRVDTGEVLFAWNSLDHIDPTETYEPLGEAGTRDLPLDYVHLNSVAVTDNGDLLLSARNTWALYRVSRDTGEIVWRLGGKRSDFTVDDNARFYWQHDARPQAGGRISLFDNRSSPAKGQQSRGMLLDVDTKTNRVSLTKEYVHPAGLLADNQGNMQVLPGGGAFVGWGCQPYVSEFDASGGLVLDARMPAGMQTYRGYLSDWQGMPEEPPAVAVGPNSGGGVTVYASWNGATGVRRWRLLAGASPSSLRAVATVPCGGFETVTVVGDDGPYYSAVALDAEGNALGEAEPVRYEG